MAKVKARELIDVVVEETSLVERGANDMPIFFAKSTDNNSFQYISKIYDDYSYTDRDTGEKMHILKAVWYRPNTIDLQGDMISEQEVADAFYDFAKNSREIKINHNGESGKGVLVENYR
ncbi:MAG: hypothetical protein EOM05_09305, partial [Clostridia bacterium]|nr:hypothetical protein [Clostridia bacterium]